MFTEKVSWQMNAAQKFVFYDYYQRLVKDDPMTPLQGYETKQNNWQPQHTTKGEWQWVHGNALVLTVQAFPLALARDAEHSRHRPRVGGC